MNFKAKFKGQDGSMGYRTGKTYLICFRTAHGSICINEYNGFEVCVYSTLRKFLDNWEVL